MKIIIKAIPSVITSLNLVCGVIATIFAFKGEIEISAALIICASVFDFFDGLAARLLKAVSEFGKQLDSLADLISFGLAPAMILYNLFLLNNPDGSFLEYSAVLIVVFSALRLAKFNIDTEQAVEFKGLPTPASALLVISIAYYCFKNDNTLTEFFLNPYVLLSISILVSALMVAPIRLLSLKIKSLKIKEIFWQLILIIGAIFLLIIFNILGIGLAIILYLALSFLKQIISIKNR